MESFWTSRSAFNRCPARSRKRCPRAQAEAPSFPDQPIYLPGFYPGDDRSDDKLLAPLVGMQVTAAAGVALGHAATHRHQILARISLHDRIRRVRASVALIMDMKKRSGDGAVGKSGKRVRVSKAICPIHRRRM